MNNFCTNCGKKLETNVIKCDECNTYVVDLKVINKKKTFRIVSTAIVVLILGIIATITCYNLYFQNLNKSLYEKYLKDDFKEAQYVKYSPCRVCTSSCEGSCDHSKKIVGCFKYYYRSNSNIENPDIVVFSNKGDISIDSYSGIINKYGFNEEKYEDADMYKTEKRTYLRIKVDYINSNNIIDIYEMVNEIIAIYKKDTNEHLDISIDQDNNDNAIDISNRSTIDDYAFEWEFKFEWELKSGYKNIIRLSNPKLEDVKRIYNNTIYNSSNKEYYYND